MPEGPLRRGEGPEPRDNHFDVERFRALVRERGLGLGDPVHYSEVTGSTNDDALGAASSGAPQGTTFVAERQTAGRGRRGRRWHDEAGASLLFSVVIRPNLSLDRASGLSLATGIAVRRAIARALPKHEAAGNVGIKWPNDVFVNGKKIAGVLAETQLESGSLRAAVLGIGVNVGTTRFPSELETIATSIGLLGEPVDREELLGSILAELGAVLDTLERSGLGALQEELVRHDVLRGTSLRVGDVQGTGAGIDAVGRLLVQRARGDIVAVVSGTVEPCRAQRA